MKKFQFHPVRSIRNRLASIQTDPMKVCYGFAFGVFMSTTPLIGFKWVVALPVVMLLRWSKVACLVGIMQVNYLTGPFFYALAYFVGKLVMGPSMSFQLPDRLNFAALKTLFFGNADAFLALLVGGMILSIPMTIGAWYLVRSLCIHKLQEQASRKHEILISQ